MLYPLKLRPVEKEYIWGREIFCNPTGMSIIENGEFAGTELYELIDANREEFLGTLLANNPAESDRFPFQIKFIEANDLLPVQVQGYNKYLCSVQKGSVQNKIWHVISAKDGTRLALGLMQDVTKDMLEKRLNDAAILECLIYIDINPGDVFGIPPGLVHAGGKGSLLVEVQTPTNLLYTLYDYNRTDKTGCNIPLSIIKALDTTDCQQQGEKYEGLEIEMNETARKLVLVATQCFSVELYIIDDEVEEETDGSNFIFYVFTEGETIIEYGNEFLIAGQGETVMIPAALGAYRLKGKFKSLKVYVPDLEIDIVQPLKKAGYSGEDIKKNISGNGGW